MTLALTQNKTALAVNLQANFQATGGTPPYTYSTRNSPANQFAGGTIDPNTGIYTAPNVVNGGQFVKPTQYFDTIQVKDNVGAIATAQIMVGDALLLFCEIIQSELKLPIGRVYLWDQKMAQPTDAGLYIAVQMLSCKPFGNTNKFDGSGSNSNQFQSVNNMAILQLDIISRDTEARDRKEEVLMALASQYAETQQEANSFLIGKLPPGSQFVNLSEQDGAAIPYRFNIAVGMQYTVVKTTPVNSFGTFQTPQVNTNP